MGEERERFNCELPLNPGAGDSTDEIPLSYDKDQDQWKHSDTSGSHQLVEGRLTVFLRTLYNADSEDNRPR